MKVAIYARVSTERQAERGTVGSQLAALRHQVSTAHHQLINEFIDDGYSGARLNRPGLDALRDAAEAGLFDAVWCLSPDRLARVYAYQVLVLDELARFGVEVHFSDAPDFAPGDPQATLLTQVQGVIAEYEKAKIAERYRRGKLFRARAGEITWKTAYGYRRVARSAATGSAHLEIYEPEAAVGGIFADRAAGTTVQEVYPWPQRRSGAVTDGEGDVGALHAVPAAAQRSLCGTGLLQPHRIGADRQPAAAAVRCRVTAPTGSGSTVPASSPTRCSRPCGSQSTTANGARAGPIPEQWLLRGWSNAVPAASAPTATRCVAVTAAGTAITACP